MTHHSENSDDYVSDLIGTILFSVIGALVLCGVNRIPYVGFVFGILLAFALGRGLGWVELPVWSRVVVATLSLAGLFFGFKWQLESAFVSEDETLGASFLFTSVGTVTFLYGFFAGAARAKKENDRDTAAIEN